MSEVTSPILTDATGQEIVSKLNILLTKMDNLAAAFQPNASGIVYSNTTSGLTGDDVQEAIDEMAGDVSEINSALTELTDLTEEYLDFTYNQKTIRIYFRFRKNFVTVIAIKSDTTMEFPTAWTDIGNLSKAPSSTMYIPLNLLNGNTITLRWYPTTGKVDCLSNTSTAAWVQTTTTIMYS